MLAVVSMVSKIVKFGCSLTCTKTFLVWFDGLVWFGLSVGKLELWTSALDLASGDGELCYVGRVVQGIKSDGIELILYPCPLNGPKLNTVQVHVPYKMLVTSTI